MPIEVAVHGLRCEKGSISSGGSQWSAGTR
jgi:hypothetical protein